ncbi:MAG TPA: hypothetical protein VMT34_13280 [Aggregatilineales bacterium]|nr:hypothetical protein [Aggregatilineales bacterium]
MRIRNSIFWLMACGVALFVAAIGLNISASAQGGISPKTVTPLASPTNNGGNATWTIESNTFQSNYPAGFDFTIQAESSGGKIVEATVSWSHAPGFVKHARGKIDDSGITASWKPGSDAVPQWVGVEYWWDLKDEAGNSFQTPHQNDNYADNTRNWSHAESEDVVVYWQEGVPDDIGQKVIEAVRKERPVYVRNWGGLINYRPHVILYANWDPFKEWNPGIDTVAGGVIVQGQTSANWGGTAQVFLNDFGTEYTAYGVCLHEIDHLYQKVLGHYSLTADWFIEGDATYFEVVQDYGYLDRVRELAQSGQLPTIQGEGPAVRGANARLGYDIGYAFFKWLEVTYGPDAHLKLWRLLGQGKARVDALRQITGKSFTDMETDFRTWLGASNPVPPTLVPTPAFQFPPTPTYDNSFLPTPTAGG